VRIFRARKPLFLVGTWMNGAVAVTDIWTGKVVTASPAFHAEDVDELDIINRCIVVLTDSGYPISRVVNHTPRVKADIDVRIWSMHGPAVHSDFKIDYDPELQTAALIYEPDDNKEVIHVWSNVESPYRLEEFKNYAEHSIRNFGHHVLRSFLDDSANLRFVTYTSPLSVCRRAIAAGAAMHLAITTLGSVAIMTLVGMLGLDNLNYYGILSYMGAMILAFYLTFKPASRLARYAQDTAECWMAVRSRRRPKDA